MTPRAEFPSSVKRAALERSGGICECHLIPHVFPIPCRRPIGPGNTFFEHIDPDAISKRNDLENAAVLTKTCWRIKTDNYDKPVIAKVRHVRDYNFGIKDRWRRKLPFGRDSNIKQKLDGTVVDRRTGERL